jgi:glycosyltransferase 2 family protein
MRQRILKIGAALLGAALLGFFLRTAPWGEIFSQVSSIRWGFLLLLVITFISQYIVTIAWKLSFNNPPDHISLAGLFLKRLVGESLALVNPTNVIAGETMKAYLLKRRGVSYQDSMVSITISRFLIMLSSITLVFIGVFLFFDHLNILGNTTVIVVIPAVLCALLLGMFLLLRNERGIFYPLRLLLGHLFPEGPRAVVIRKNLEGIDRELVVFYKKRRLRFFAAYLLSLVHWLGGALEFYVILVLCGVDASFYSCVAMEIGVMVFKALGSFVPGQIGIEEYGNKVMLSFVNISNPGLWVTVSILRRARQLFWLAAGVAAFVILARKKPVEAEPA